jgi:hypothetical protein
MMSKHNAAVWCGVCWLSFLTAGCGQQRGPAADADAASSPPERILNMGVVELSKKWPVTLVVSESNLCRITTMELANGSLILDVAYTPRGAATTHTSVITRNGQEFSFPLGKASVDCKAKLKAD